MLPYNNGFIEISKNDIIIVFKKNSSRQKHEWSHKNILFISAAYN